jgi:hypothetical protein
VKHRKLADVAARDKNYLQSRHWHSLPGICWREINPIVIQVVHVDRLVLFIDG